MDATNNNNNKRQSYLVSFIGIDGSGKSTIAEKIVSEMQSHGYETELVPCRFNLPILKHIDFLATIIYSSFFGERPYHLAMKSDTRENECTVNNNIKKKILKNHHLRIISLYTVMILYFFQILIKINLPRRKGLNIVCDRYIHDTLVDLAVAFEYPEDKLKNLLNKYYKIFPIPDFIFLVDLPAEIAYERNLRKKDGLSVAYLAERKRAYLDMVHSSSVFILDGMQEPDALARQVKETIFSKGTNSKR